MRKPLITSTQHALHYVWGDHCDGWWLKENGLFTVISEMMPPDSSEIRHFHQVTEQFFYVIEGELTIEQNDKEYILQKNEGISIPIGCIHKVSNHSNQNVSFLVISCPESHLDRINIENPNQSFDKNSYILNELKRREPIFHHPDEFGRTRQDILNMTCEGFWEVGASGTIYTREEVIETLLARYTDPTYIDEWETKDFKLNVIAPNSYLLTYLLFQGERVTRRATLWRYQDNEWKIVYHQGTLVGKESLSRVEPG